MPDPSLESGDAPLEVVGAGKRFDVIATVKGSGTTGQAGAIAMGLARALRSLTAPFRKIEERPPFPSRERLLPPAPHAGRGTRTSRPR
ncbi:MAG: 30S ribosomal protein S9, partial [Ilumatobacteraceae bacterium]